MNAASHALGAAKQPGGVPPSQQKPKPINDSIEVKKQVFKLKYLVNLQLNHLNEVG